MTLYAVQEKKINALKINFIFARSGREVGEAQRYLHYRQLKERLVTVNAMKPHGKVTMHIHLFLPSALDGRDWSVSTPGLRFTPRGNRPPVPTEYEPESQCEHYGIQN
jgi:hypothetical protein